MSTCSVNTKLKSTSINIKQFSFIFLLLVLSYVLGMQNIDLFELSQDFNANTFMLTQEGYGIKKGVFYYAYRVLFSSFISEEQYLVAIWSLIPAGVAAAFILILNEMRLLKTGGGMLVMLLAQASLYYMNVLRFILEHSMIPTGHLLFQSASSVFIIMAILFSGRSKKLLWVFGILAIALHYSSVLYITIAFLFNKLTKYNILNNLKLSKRGFKNTLIGIALLFSFIFSFLYLAEFIRGYGADDPLGVDSELILVINLSLCIGIIALLLSRIYLNSRKYWGRKLDFNFYLLYKSLFAISLVSLMMSIFHLGLAYRFNYISYIASPIMLLASLMMAAKITLK